MCRKLGPEKSRASGFISYEEARIHMASAMTMLGKTDNDNFATYLDIADWITAHSPQAKKDLKELWSRIVFNIAIANADDHL
ncbi:HipA domain-containing protein [Selenomonas sp. KH1T6]|uniref:HipA domain-containing protein n=1 Tax=Selenomonas sp. KH1T6 TaxID=3158784 RepID=UPI000944F46C